MISPHSQPSAYKNSHYISTPSMVSLIKELRVADKISYRANAHSNAQPIVLEK